MTGLVIGNVTVVDGTGEPRYIADVAIVDARTDLAAARGLCRLLGTTGTSVPVVAVVNEGVWRLFSEETWAFYKTFGQTILIFGFTLTQLPMIMAHELKKEEAPEGPEPHDL